MAYNNNAKDIAYNFILNKIKNNEWKPDEKIWTEDVLVKNTGVSRIAIRNAVEKLVGMGILRKVQGSGTFVQSSEDVSILSMPLFSLSNDEMLQLLELRKYLEPATVEMFIKNFDENDVLELEKLYNEMVENVNDMNSFHKADFAFHKVISRGSKNTFVIKINDLLVDILENHQKDLYGHIGPQIGLEYHKLILKYIKQKDIELASIYMKKHMEKTIEAVIDAFEKERVLNE